MYMISRKTTLYVANIIIDKFTYEKYNRRTSVGGYYSHIVAQVKLSNL